jgi:hypothetical protein
VLVRRLTKNSSESNRDFSDALRGDSVVMDRIERREKILEITKDSLFRRLPAHEE